MGARDGQRSFRLGGRKRHGVLGNVPDPHHKYGYNTLEGLVQRPDSTCPDEEGNQCEEGEAVEGKVGEKDILGRVCNISIVQKDWFVPGFLIIVVVVIVSHFEKLKELSDQENHQNSGDSVSL